MAITRSVTGAFATLIALLSVSLCARAAGEPATSPRAGLSGLWAATASAAGLRIPFRFELHQTPHGLTGWLFNGDTQVVASQASITGSKVILRFQQFARELDLTRGAEGSLEGTYAAIASSATGADDRGQQPAQGAARRRPISFEIQAQRWHAAPANAEGASVPSIAGLWLVPAQSRKANEKAWRLIVRQKGAEVDAAILRVDGDTGTLSGSWNNGHLLLSNFSGTRAELLQVTPAAPGTLTLVIYDLHQGQSVYTAYNLQEAAAHGVPGAADAAHHTDVRDRDEVLRFSGVDLTGRVISNGDKQFVGKVVLVDVSGSWCPNCHDEAPFLQTLYHRFHSRGLEVVALDFEEPDQLSDSVRLRAFVNTYHLDYTVLLDGTPDQVHDKLPQAVNLDAWPTTFFVGRDGRVKAVHTGFAAPASGEFYTRLRAAYIQEIEQLLTAKGSENAGSRR